MKVKYIHVESFDLMEFTIKNVIQKFNPHLKLLDEERVVDF